MPRRPERTVASGMDKRSFVKGAEIANDILRAPAPPQPPGQTIKFSMAPWFTVLAEELGQAGTNAMRRGVEPGLVRECVRAALCAVVPEAVTFTDPRTVAP